tara:strand:+ start:26397 stop:26885 length:489 start_codon:yes stop_codon:yes gene_type:complete
MDFNSINIIIILFVSYFAYKGFVRGFIKELSLIISYIAGFAISKTTGPMLEIFLNLEIFIKSDPLRQKIAYLLSFIIIIYLFKFLSYALENFINMKWQNKLLGFLIGILNGILIFSLIISIFKEILPTINIHDEWSKRSSLYRGIDTLQKEYLIQYKNYKNN